MEQSTETRMVKVVFVYTTWLVLLLGSGALLIRGDGLRLAGVLPWLAAVVVAMAGSDELEDLHRERLGRSVARSAFALMGVLLMVAMATGPPSYLAALGQRGTAIVTDVRADPGQLHHPCRVTLAATGQDLGWMPKEQCDRSEPGDRIEVSYDPRGWSAPMAADGLPSSRTGAVVMVLWLLTAAGTTATAITVAAVDLSWSAPGPVPL